MSTVLEQPTLPEARMRRGAWLILAAAFLALYIPTFVDLARTLWREEDYAHGPIILAVAAFLFWRSRNIPLAAGSRAQQAAGGLVLLAGLVSYIVGQSQSLALFSTASILPVVAGALLIVGGTAALRRFGFAILFLLFLIPLPGFIVEAATGPLKQFVSAVVAAILGAMGYPIERSGVVLDMGGHQMLVADACSGMNSIVSLTALTLLYAHLTGPSAPRRWVALLASIVPIAIAANVVRVLVLVLVAYHVGDDAAQGAVHTLAGLLVFVTAFALLIGLDSLVGGRRAAATGNDSRAHSNQAIRTSYLAPIVVAALMVCSALAAPLLKPVHAEGSAALVLESMVPQAFGDWSIDPTIMPIAPTADVQAKLDRIYNQTVSRTYVNSAGEHMMLTVAYGGDQSDALKAHRQEVCYTAQGFSIHGLHHATLGVQGGSIPVTRMLAVREERSEPVTYWFTMGDRVVRGRVERLTTQIREGFAGRIPDGMLVRVSSISGDERAAYAAQQSFIAALLGAMPSTDRARLAGAAQAGKSS
ncbi:MAG TPA: exosortase B [Usitatibacter sp.]|nr:exosortase B [Usitatibacter sp.]